MTTHPTRRTVLTVAAFGAVASIAGCASTSAGASGHGATAAPRPSGRRIDATAAFTALEQEFDARLGVQAVETGTGDTVQHRPDERFAFASTVKALAAAAVLQTHSIEALDVVIHYTADDLVAYSPITEQHVDTGMPLREIATAAVQHSDNTAGNLLFAQLGGPAELTAILRGVGDDTISVDRIEPDLNEATPGDPRDTSTPRALTATLSRYVLGDALAQQQRALLNDWLRGNTTGGALIRAAAPGGWTVGDKTGAASYGTRNDIAILWPPASGRRSAPVALSILSSRSAQDASYDDALIARAAAVALDALGVH